MAGGIGPKTGPKYPRNSCDLTHLVVIIIDFKILVLVHNFMVSHVSGLLLVSEPVRLLWSSGAGPLVAPKCRTKRFGG